MKPQPDSASAAPSVESLRQLLVKADSYLSLLWYRYVPPDRKSDITLGMEVERTIAELRSATVQPFLDHERSLVAEIQRLREGCEESNAVCICGCSLDAHERYDSDGESCQDETHECFRVPPAALDVAQRLRAEIQRLTDALKTYAQHRDGCGALKFGITKHPILGDVISDARFPCTCGLTDALAAQTQKDQP